MGIELKQAPDQAQAEQANLHYSKEISKRKQAWESILQHKLQVECYYTIIVTRKCGETPDEHQLSLYKTTDNNGFILYEPNLGFRHFKDAETLATLMINDTNIHKKFTIIDQERLLKWYKGYELAGINGNTSILRKVWSYPAASLKSTIEITSFTYHCVKTHYYIASILAITLALVTKML
jgi:hypothetical protein